MTPTRRGATVAMLSLALVNIIWGANFPLTKPALETIPPFLFALLRFVVAMAVLAPMAGREAVTLLRGEDGWRLALMGFLGMCIAQVAQTLALRLSPASDISLVAATTPLWVVLLAWLWLRERLASRMAMGCVLALLGLVLILWPRSGGEIGLQRILGDAACLVSALAWACYNVMGKRIMQRHSPLAATTAAGLVGTACIIPFAAGELLAGEPVRFSVAGLAGVAYAGLLVTALGFVVLFRTLRRVQAMDAAMLMYLQPLAGISIAGAVLGEALPVQFFAGAALVFVAVGLLGGVGARNPKVQPQIAVPRSAKSPDLE